MENNVQNNTPAPWYFKYIFIVIVIIVLILLFMGIKMASNNSSKDNSETTIEEISTISISDLSKYESCLIWNNEAYFLFDNMLVDKSLLDEKLGTTNSAFNSNKDNIYDAIDGAVYEYSEGMEFYSIKENPIDIAVDTDNELGYLVFSKDIDKYKETYEENLNFKENKETYLYTNALEEDFSTSIELSNNIFKDIKECEYITDMENYEIFLLTINNNNYLYSYICLYDNINKKAIIQNQISKTGLEFSFDLEDFDENN